jgi:hypothetical protein
VHFLQFWYAVCTMKNLATLVSYRLNNTKTDIEAIIVISARASARSNEC